MTQNMVLSKKISISQGTANRDFANLWELENGNFLAFLADAPSRSEQRVGLMINSYIMQNLENLKKGLNDMEQEEISLYMADLMTGIGDELLKIGKGSAYATLSMVLVVNEYIYIAAVGDSVVYLMGKSTIRISEITRLNGHSILGNDIPAEPARYKEYSYIGSEKRIFARENIYRIPAGKVKLVTLVSDGAETQYGVKNLLNILKKESSLEEKEKTFRQILSSQSIKDDVTILMAEINIKYSKPAQFLQTNRQVEEKNLQDEINRKIDFLVKNKIPHLEGKIENFKPQEVSILAQDVTDPGTGEKQNLLKFIENRIDSRMKKSLTEIKAKDVSLSIISQIHLLNKKFATLEEKLNQLESQYEHESAKRENAKPYPGKSTGILQSLKTKKFGLIFLLILIIGLITLKYFNPFTGKDKSQTQLPQVETTVKPEKYNPTRTVEGQSAKTAADSTVREMNENFQTYLAYLVPTIFTSQRPEIKNEICKTFKEFENSVLLKQSKVIYLLPLDIAADNWEKLKEYEIEEYRVTSEKLSMKLISKVFVTLEEDFKRLQFQQGSKIPPYYREDKFRYRAFYYKVITLKDTELEIIADTLGLKGAVEKLKTINDTGNEVKKGTSLYIPLKFEPPTLIKNRY